MILDSITEHLKDGYPYSYARLRLFVIKIFVWSQTGALQAQLKACHSMNFMSSNCFQ